MPRADLVDGAMRGAARWPTLAANAITARNREGGERGGGGDGSSINRAKFKIPVCKFNFSSYSKGEMKNF